MLTPFKVIMLISGWISAFFIEKRYVSRQSQLGIILPVFYSMQGFDFLENVFIDNPWLAWKEWNLHGYVKAYLCLGVVLGFVGWFRYLTNQQCSKNFYQVTFWLYSSKTVMPLATSIALFSRSDSTLLYKEEFWGASVLLFLLSWFPEFTMVTILLVFGLVYYAKK